MGLDDAYSHTRGQILLMDPLPSVNKVFALVLQEERQREVAAQSQGSESAAFISKSPSPAFASVDSFSASDSSAFVAKAGYQTHSCSSGQTSKKEKPTCSYCGKLGHTQDKCYRLHGFPPGFVFTKSKGCLPTANQANSASSQLSQDLSQLTITPEHCHQILSMLKPQLQAYTSTTTRLAKPQSSVNQVSGFHLDANASALPSTSAFSGNVVSHLNSINSTPPMTSWIIDMGATDHMVCSLSLLSTITATINATVKLPTGDHILVSHIGTVVISNTLTLHNVLCIPDFSFNLISASKLVSSHNCCLIFLSSFCFIQDLSTWKMIGVGTLEGGMYHLRQAIDSKPIPASTWIYLMHSKSQVRLILSSFFTLIETQFSTNIKCIHTDNGIEFHMPQLYVDRGIIHHKSYVETPQ